MATDTTVTSSTNRALRGNCITALLLFLATSLLCSAQQAVPATAHTPAPASPSATAGTPAVSITAADSAEAEADARRMITYTDALVLGVVEGLTEFLPVSSTGHLILADRLLGLDSDEPLLKADGQPLMVGKPGEEEPFTLSNAIDAYIIIIQFGAIAAVVVLYWRRLLSILQGLLGKNPHGLLLLRNLVLAFLPAAVIGLILEDWIDAVLFGVKPVLIALVAGAILMLAVEALRKRRTAQAPIVGNKETAGPDLHELSPVQSLVIGFLQCIAMWPGTSRSMMTIVGGYIVGLNPVRAAEFSFLLGLITLSAASFYKTLTVGPAMAQTLPAGPVIFGLFVAGVSAVIAVRWFVHYLTRHGLTLFAWYRIALAVICAIYLL